MILTENFSKEELGELVVNEIIDQLDVFENDDATDLVEIIQTALETENKTVLNLLSLLLGVPATEIADHLDELIEQIEEE